MELIDDLNLVSLDTSFPIWDRFFSVSPLVLIGSKEEGDGYNLAPKHMATAMGWGNYFGFVCTPYHNTFKNIVRQGEFAVSFPQPSQVVLTSLAASPRWEDGSKPGLPHLETFPAIKVDSVFIDDAYLYFECRRHKIIDGFDENSLITGEIVAAYARPEFVRHEESDDQQILKDSPLLAYINPGRFARIQESFSFPFPKGMKK